MWSKVEHHHDECGCNYNQLFELVQECVHMHVDNTNMGAMCIGVYEHYLLLKEND